MTQHRRLRAWYSPILALTGRPCRTNKAPARSPAPYPGRLLGASDVLLPGKPNNNAFIEPFNRSLRNEVLNAWQFNRVKEVQTAADHWLAVYNEYRPHDCLGCVPPVVFKPRLFNREFSTFKLCA